MLERLSSLTAGWLSAAGSWLQGGADTGRAPDGPDVSRCKAVPVGECGSIVVGSWRTGRRVGPGRLDRLAESLRIPPALHDGLPGSEAIFSTALFFRPRSNELEAIARTEIEVLARTLRSVRWLRVRLDGHADAAGPYHLNRGLAEQRVAAVRHTLQALGVDRERLVERAHGNRLATHSAHDPDGRCFDRRVDIVCVL